jgi:hypothetical protein
LLSKEDVGRIEVVAGEVTIAKRKAGEMFFMVEIVY